MIFNDHSSINGHAFLSASNYHWINYDDHKLEARFRAHRMAARGTSLHDLAHKAIQLGVKLSNADRTIAAYVRDGINYKMSVEQTLYYSENCFGTPDTICFRKALLRVHDYKSGIIKASMHQLEIYASLFCLEYGVDPYEIEMELRIYQNSEIRIHVPDPAVIERIMDKIVYFDQRIEELKGDM